MKDYFVINIWEKGWYNTLNLNLYFPSFEIQTRDDMFDEPMKGIKISFDCNVHGNLHRDGWSFGFKIFGFGLGIWRQWGY